MTFLSHKVFLLGVIYKPSTFYQSSWYSSFPSIWCIIFMFSSLYLTAFSQGWECTEQGYLPIWVIAVMLESRSAQLTVEQNLYEKAHSEVELTELFTNKWLRKTEICVISPRRQRGDGAQMVLHWERRWGPDGASWAVWLCELLIARQWRWV